MACAGTVNISATYPGQTMIANNTTGSSSRSSLTFSKNDEISFSLYATRNTTDTCNVTWTFS